MRFVVASDRGLEMLRELAPELKAAGHDLTVIAIGGDAESGELDYEQLLAGASDARPRLDLTDDDHHALRFTGGTTGLPKGILYDNRGMVNVINNHLLNWEITTDEVVCHFHPLSHAAGMLMWTWWMRGCKQVILPAFNFDPEGLLAEIERHRVTTFFIIPSALNRVLDSEALTKHDTSSLKYVIYGAAPIAPKRIQEAIDAFGPVLLQIYGLSEAPNAITSLLPEDHVFEGEPPDRLRSAGRRQFNVEVRVVDADGRECAPGEDGEVISRGPHTMRHYWRDEERTREKVIDGWVYSGDVGHFDEEGYLYIVDRKDDVVISGGFNIWPTEIESVIASHPAVGEVGVFGVEDDRWGEALNAVVVPRPGASTTEEDLKDLVAESLARYKIPKRILIRDQPLPKSGVGKVLRRRLREEVLAATTDSMSDDGADT